jgi:hypothetical protein
MKPITITIALLLVLAGCTQKPAPVASNTAPATPAERLAIAVEYVAVPVMKVHARPADDSPVVGSYGFSEAVSVLEKKGEWNEVRTFDGSGWAKAIDMMNAEKRAQIDPLTPRFYQEPAKIPWGRHGELTFQAKVNTDGQVVEVKLTKNTTGSDAIANANSDALKQALFYPMVDQGSRKTFIYEYRVYY